MAIPFGIGVGAAKTTIFIARGENKCSLNLWTVYTRGPSSVHSFHRRAILFANYTLVRPDAKLARYKMFTHEHESSNGENEARYDLLYVWKESRATDGLNQLRY